MNRKEDIRAFKQAKKGILLMELNREEFSGLRFNDVNYIIFLDLLSQTFLNEDENFRFALGRAVHIGHDLSRKITTVRFIVNNSIDDELYNSRDDKHFKETSCLVDRVMNEFNQT